MATENSLYGKNLNFLKNKNRKFDNVLESTYNYADNNRDRFGNLTQWNLNFGGPTVEGQPLATSNLNILSGAPRFYSLFQALRYGGYASQGTPVTAAQAGKLLGGTGVLGTDVAIGTNASPGQTPMVSQRVDRLTGDIAGTVTMTNAADVASSGMKGMMIFKGNNTFSSTGILKLGTHDDRAADAESSETFVTQDMSTQNAVDENTTCPIMTRGAALTDNDTLIVLTDTGDSTILEGSFVYWYCGHNTDVTAFKICLVTIGGTVAVTGAS